MHKRIKNIVRGFFNNIFPCLRYSLFDLNRYYIRSFVKKCSEEVGDDKRILDAGAGSCPFKKYFLHSKYESTDFEQIFDQRNKGLHNFICDLQKIPCEKNEYDFILNTEVLEHVPYPQEVIKEFYRILKPKGRLFLTTPQSWEVHGYPYNFFNFTKGGLELLFKNAGFRIIGIYPRGGIFSEIGTKIKELPTNIFFQYFFVGRKNKKLTLTTFKPFSIILFPLLVLSWIPCQIIIPPLCFFLDKIDKKKSFTLGYCCIVEKP
jgi:SAM-dependent methyltransferase